MAQIDHPLVEPVPNLHGDAAAWRAHRKRRRPRLASDLAAAVLAGGIVLTLAWGGILVWSVFSIVRALIG
jgi:hypothetical protein